MNAEINITIEPLLVGVDDVALLLGIGRTLFLQLEESGRIGPLPVKFGRRKLYSVNEFRQWVKGGCSNRETWETQKAEFIENRT